LDDGVHTLAYASLTKCPGGGGYWEAIVVLKLEEDSISIVFSDIINIITNCF